MVLRLLSRLASRRTSEWNGGDIRRRPRAIRTGLAGVLVKPTEADFQAWREARDWHQPKYAMRERGELLPSQKPNSIMRCPCGVTFDSHDPAGSYVHREHVYARQTAHTGEGDHAVRRMETA
jgi:hypothetical protein